MNIIDFLNEENIDWFPINLRLTTTDEVVNGEPRIKKELLPIRHKYYEDCKNYIPSYKDFENLDKEIIKARQTLVSQYKYIWVSTNQVHQIDIDTPEYGDAFIKMLSVIPYYKSISKSYGRHLFIYDDGFIPDKLSYRFKCNKDVEYLCGQGAYACKDDLVFNHENDYELSDMEKQLDIPETNTSYEPEDMSEVTKFHKDILDNINPDLYSSYNDWCKMVWACRFSFTSGGLTLADKLSRKARGYKGLSDVKNTYDSATDKRIGWGYLMNLSKKSNKTNHYRIINSHNPSYETSDFDLVEMVTKLLGDDVVKSNGVFYLYDNPYWVRCEGEKISLLKKRIMKLLREYYLQVRADLSSMATQIESQEERDINENKIEKVNKIIQKVTQESGYRSVFNTFNIEFEADDTIDFDTYKPYYFCFNDKAFDLETNKPVEIKRTDYITQTTGYEFKEASLEEVDEIEKIIHSIFPDEEKRICYVSFLRTCMMGLQFQNFMIANGSGGNGKGNLNGLMGDTLGDDYYYNGNITTITQKRQSGASPEIANMNKKRMVKFEEPDDKDSLNLGTIKNITGDSRVNARKLYSNDTKVTLQLSVVLECNKKPKIDGRIDDSIIRRFIDLPFESTFTNREDLLKLDNYYKANPYYTTKEFRDKYKHALFAYLLKQDYMDIVVSKKIQEHTNEYYYENDEFTAVMDDLYELTDDNSVVNLKDMFEAYRETYYTSGTRKYKTYTRKHFFHELQSNIKWKHIVATRFRKRTDVDGKQMRNIFLGLREKTPED